MQSDSVARAVETHFDFYFHQLKVAEQITEWQTENLYLVFLHFFMSKDSKPLCSGAIDECYAKDQFIPDPRTFGLTEDFIFIEHEWGSMFYKNIGKNTRADAKELCAAYGDSVHLPIPRFQEENEFYRKYFADETLWLDISRMSDGDYNSSYGQLFIRHVLTASRDIEYIKSHDWMSLSNIGSEFVILTKEGEWKTTDLLNKRDSVCVVNISPDENCSNCPDEAFCRFKNETKQETECVCSIDREGEFCQNDLCSHCQNGGSCRLNNEDLDQFDCICPKPFFGDHCTNSKNFPF